MSGLNYIRRCLSLSVDGASLGIFRICVGVIMALEAWSLCRPNRAALSTDKTPLETYYTGANIHLHFPFEGFEWLPLLPPAGIHAVVGVLGISAVLMAAGLFYRAAATGVFLSWFYLWMVESTRTYWQSHYYLETLVTFLMIWMPAASRFSVDAVWRGRIVGAGTIPFWPIAVLRAQLVIAYFHAGLAKVNRDWIEDAMPVRWFLSEPGVTEPFRGWLGPGAYGAFVEVVHSAAAAYFLAYAGLIFDLVIGALLLARRTRILGMFLMGIFHFTNHTLIFDDIGWFPFLGFFTALIFLDVDWPVRFFGWIRRPRVATPDWRWLVGGGIALPLVGASLGWRLAPTPRKASPAAALVSLPVVAAVIGWTVWQALFPLRHYAIPGDGRFTYEGMSFSWRLKSEARRAVVHELRLTDRTILGLSSNGVPQFHWALWHGPKTLYRVINTTNTDWGSLPSIAVFFDPVGGERVVYNPAGDGYMGLSPAAGRDVAVARWREIYGRAPAKVQPVVALPELLVRLANGLKAGGLTDESARCEALVVRLRMVGVADESVLLRESEELLAELRRRDKGGKVASMLATLQPFALVPGASRPPALFVIEDPQVMEADGGRLRPTAWRTVAATRSKRDVPLPESGWEPMLIHVTSINAGLSSFLPGYIAVDNLPEGTSYIWWNSMADLPPSKILHTSIQPFYLRRYARHVADRWESDYGRRPEVRAITSASLNGRPYQALVEPGADLAAVGHVWLGHNDWIRDLETPRIPPEARVRPQ